MNTNEASVWLGSLAAYNNSRLLGDWFEWDERPTTPKEWVEAMIERGLIRDTPEPSMHNQGVAELAQLHEEIVALDHEGLEWAGVSEPGFGTLDKIDEIFRHIEHAGHGDHRWDAYKAFTDNLGSDPLDTETVDDFYERFRGIHASVEDYVQELFEEIHDLESIPATLRYRIDWKGVAKDLKLSGDIWSTRLDADEVAIFTH